MRLWIDYVGLRQSRETAGQDGSRMTEEQGNSGVRRQKSREAAG
nr:hypothetical protein [uncultured Acetatifactor sp.]